MIKPIFYGTVHILFYRNDNEVLLLKRKNTGFEDGKWGIVAGKIEGGEEVVSAAIREAKEEAGVIIDSTEVKVVGVMHRNNIKNEWIDFYVKVDSWQGEIVNVEVDKCEELKWFEVDKLPTDMVSFIRKAIEKNHKQMWFESFGWE
ncbi:NUDIX hydrolase [Chengkuizengella axinellae]|uniref:NUDIX domain-containing protein n=1 Tax=Chengkuizengella axinellae TaxID=3064388 RepID=A0ABT9IU16_9BACL|nr:NUDIX domain-containing protein [Chengkuizengella sp. 2205SS18-9]MDP5272846.1 NUDIX domain-containing protein [Chengkuizengella sp. 2205SS18-9]